MQVLYPVNKKNIKMFDFAIFKILKNIFNTVYISLYKRMSSGFQSPLAVDIINKCKLLLSIALPCVYLFSI